MMGRSDDVDDVFGRENDSAARNSTLADLFDIIRYLLDIWSVRVYLAL